LPKGFQVFIEHLQDKEVMEVHDVIEWLSHRTKNWWNMYYFKTKNKYQKRDILLHGTSWI